MHSFARWWQSLVARQARLDADDVLVMRHDIGSPRCQQVLDGKEYLLIVHLLSR